MRHYHPLKGLTQPIDLIESQDLNFNCGNVVKYICRAGRKEDDRLTDLKKAMWYLQREIDLELGYQNQGQQVS